MAPRRPDPVKGSPVALRPLYLSLNVYRGRDGSWMLSGAVKKPGGRVPLTRWTLNGASLDLPPDVDALTLSARLRDLLEEAGGRWP